MRSLVSRSTSCAQLHSPQASYGIPADVSKLASKHQEPQVTPRPVGGGLKVCDDLRLGAKQEFDPSEPAVRFKLLKSLGADPEASIECMRGFRGGQNEGVWFLKSRSEDLVLKLVKRPPGGVTEADNFRKLHREHPSIVGDHSIAFPQQLVRVLAGDDVHLYDLIVMRRARGQMLGNLIQERWHAGQASEVMAILEKVGQSARDFHLRYGGKQHCDLSSSNVVVDEATRHITLIDAGGMGGSWATNEQDLEHFERSLRMMFEFIEPSAASEAVQRFRDGYAAGKGTRSPVVGSRR